MYMCIYYMRSVVCMCGVWLHVCCMCGVVCLQCAVYICSMWCVWRGVCVYVWCGVVCLQCVMCIYVACGVWGCVCMCGVTVCVCACGMRLLPYPCYHELSNPVSPTHCSKDTRSVKARVASLRS